MSYADLTDLPFCPGCTHEGIFKGFTAALEKRGQDPREIVVVSDIGCHGIADRALNVHTFHGLHGRSITYATGIKMARPSLKVLVLVGDGGCGIGGAHLINAARRNVPICVLVFNNFNFGMTGGQHSVTTPCGGRTSTTPEGNGERGLDLARLAEASGATFVARATAFDPNLADIVGRGLEHEGFALIDVWGLCTAHYMKRNEIRKARLIESAGVTGVLHEEKTAPFAHRAGRVPEPDLASLAVPVEFGSPLGRRMEIVLAGSAGMRVRTAAMLLARAAIRSGLYAAQKDTFPVTVMKGFSVSELILSPRKIEDLQVTSPDVLVIASDDGRKKTTALQPASHRILDIADHPFPGLRKTELALAMGAAALRDVLPAEALRKTVEEDGHAEDRSRLLAAISHP